MSATWMITCYEGGHGTLASMVPKEDCGTSLTPLPMWALQPWVRHSSETLCSGAFRAGDGFYRQCIEESTE